VGTALATSIRSSGEVIASDETHRVVAHGDVIVAVYRELIPLRALELQRLYVRERLRESGPHRMGLLKLMLPGVPPPDEILRRAIASLHREIGAAGAGAALVHEGEGFVAASIRAIATSIHLLNPQPFPLRVFSGVTEAAGWLAMVTEHDLGTLLRTVEDGRRALARPLVYGRAR